MGARNKSFVNSIALLCKVHKKYRNKTAREKPNAVPFSPPILPQQQASKFANTIFFSEKLPHPRPLTAKSSLDHANAGYEEVYLPREERLDEGAINYLCRIDPGRGEGAAEHREDFLAGGERSAGMNSLLPQGWRRIPRRTVLDKTQNHWCWEILQRAKLKRYVGTLQLLQVVSAGCH